MRTNLTFLILANGRNETKSEHFKGGLNTLRTHCIYINCLFELWVFMQVTCVDDGSKVKS